MNLKKVSIYDIEFYKKLEFVHTKKSYSLFSKELLFDFKAYTYVELYSEILFDYQEHSDIGLLKTKYIFYDDRDVEIEKFNKYQINSGRNADSKLITKDYLLFISKSDNTKLKLDIYVSLINDIDRHTKLLIKFINDYEN